MGRKIRAKLQDVGVVAAASCPECLIEGLGRRVFRSRFGIG